MSNRLPTLPTLPTELTDAAENIVDGWYANGGSIEWEDFLYRLEEHTGIELGDSLDSPMIRAIKKHVRAYRSLAS